MEVGDLIIIVESMPKWDWIGFQTGDVAVILGKIKFHDSPWTLKIFIPRTQKRESIPETFAKKLGDEK
mgnify:CR=1 FL=1|tara:strand:+ start:1342 stop:1545 length:204 start_codon:yes stop_codon:yes gene_type:complete